MSIKNIFDRFFYLEDEDYVDEHQNNPKQTQETRQQQPEIAPVKSQYAAGYAQRETQKMLLSLR